MVRRVVASLKKTGYAKGGVARLESTVQPIVVTQRRIQKVPTLDARDTFHWVLFSVHVLFENGQIQSTPRTVLLSSRS